MDVPGALLAGAVRLLDSGRAEWGRAMVGELATLERRAQRWSFVQGCLLVLLLLPFRRGQPGRVILGSMGAGAVGCVALVGYALVRYPGLDTGTVTWLSVAGFLAVLAGYTLVGRVVVRRLTGRTGSATRAGLLGGVVTAALWLGIGGAAASRSIASAGVVVALAIPVTASAVGATAAWRGRSAAAGREAAALSAMFAGLVVFLVWVGAAVLTGGRPYDSGLLRDFHTSGAPDLATYAVSDNLGAGMMLLLLVPVLTASIGLAGAGLAAWVQRPDRRPAA